MSVPSLLVLLSHLVVTLLLLIEYLQHGHHDFFVVVSHSSYALDHSINVLETSLFLEIFNLLP